MYLDVFYVPIRISSGNEGLKNSDDLRFNAIDEIKLDTFLCETGDNSSFVVIVVLFIAGIIEYLDNTIVNVAAAKANILDGSMSRTANFPDLTTSTTDGSTTSCGSLVQGRHFGVCVIRTLPAKLFSERFGGIFSIWGRGERWVEAVKMPV